jgi:D-arabinose 1-dehydrogenase-like Zn-dependent alcohol dehydrogenase
MLSYKVTAFGQPLEKVVTDSPEPQNTEVLLNVSVCGVCHSDVHLHDGFFDLGDGQKVDATRVINPPRTLGHEILGTVVALGPDAKGVAKGDRRVIFPWIGCGQCALCRSGNEHICNRPHAIGIQRDGGFSDQVLVPHPKYLFEFGNLPEEQACTYACSGLTAYSALKKATPLADEPLLIIGAGGVGLSGIRLAKEVFKVAPIVAELNRNVWEAAREAGAREVIDPSEKDAVRLLLKSTGGGVAAAIDFVGAGPSFAFGFDVLRKGGKLVCVGLFGGSTPIAPAMVSMKVVTVSGSYVGSLQEMHELMEIARAQALPALPITMRPLANVSNALEDLKGGKVRGRIVVRP